MSFDFLFQTFQTTNDSDVSKGELPTKKDRVDCEAWYNRMSKRKKNIAIGVTIGFLVLLIVIIVSITTTATYIAVEDDNVEDDTVVDTQWTINSQGRPQNC